MVHHSSERFANNSGKKYEITKLNNIRMFGRSPIVKASGQSYLLETSLRQVQTKSLLPPALLDEPAH